MLFEAQGRSGKNKAVEMEDIKFHQCVRLARFENDRTISFIPPDGNFDLMCAPQSQWSETRDVQLLGLALPHPSVRLHSMPSICWQRRSRGREGAVHV